MDDEERYRQYVDYRNQLIEVEHKNNVRIEKDTFFLAAGGIIILLIICNRLSPDDFIFNLLVFSNLFFFILPVIIIPISLILNGKAIKKKLEQLDRYYYQNDEDAFNGKNIYAELAEKYRWISLISLVLAFVSFFVMTWII